MHEPNKIAVNLGEAFIAAMREAVREEIHAIIGRTVFLKASSLASTS